MVRRGPTFSSHFPANAADNPRNTIASENIQPSVVSDQSPDTDESRPMTRVSGRLNTENAYACPIHKWTANAAGGTIHREKPGLAIVASFEKKPGDPGEP